MDLSEIVALIASGAGLFVMILSLRQSWLRREVSKLRIRNYIFVGLFSTAWLYQGISSGNRALILATLISIAVLNMLIIVASKGQEIEAIQAQVQADAQADAQTDTDAEVQTDAERG